MIVQKMNHNIDLNVRTGEIGYRLLIFFIVMAILIFYVGNSMITSIVIGAVFVYYLIKISVYIEAVYKLLRWQNEKLMQSEAVPTQTESEK